MEGFVKSLRHHWSPRRRRSIACSQLLLVLLILLPSVSYAKVKRQTSSQDTPSGFFPGIINYFAGNGTTGGSYSDGSIPTQVPLSQLGPLASDSHGNIYIADGSTALYMVYAGGSVPATLANVSRSPVQGRIYQITGLVGACGQIMDATCGEGMPLNLASFGSIAGLAFDSAGNLFVAEPAGMICEITTDGVQTTFASTSAYFYGLAFNHAGDLFAADLGGGNIYEYAPDGTQSVFASGLDDSAALAFDSSGNLFVSGTGGDNIYEITPDGTQSIFASGVYNSYGLAIQPAPEPSAPALLATGVAILFALVRRKRMGV